MQESKADSSAPPIQRLQSPLCDSFYSVSIMKAFFNPQLFWAAEVNFGVSKWLDFSSFDNECFPHLQFLFDISFLSCFPSQAVLKYLKQKT